MVTIIMPMNGLSAFFIKGCCFDRNIHFVNAEGKANSMAVERTFSVWKLSRVQQ